MPIFSDAWREARTAAAAPGLLEYATIELRHAAFIQDGAAYAIRLVRDVVDDMTFTLEDGAALDPGAAVSFKARQFEDIITPFQEGQVPSCRVSIDNVGRELLPSLEAAAQMRADLVLTYRLYRSDDLSAPYHGPFDYVLRQVSIRGTRVEGNAVIDNLDNRKFPSRVATLALFAGLRA